MINNLNESNDVETSTLGNVTGIGPVTMPTDVSDGSGDTTEPVKKKKRFLTYKKYLEIKKKMKDKETDNSEETEEE